MYSFVSAIAKAHGSYARWQTVDVAGKTFPELYNLYRELILTLNNSALPTLVTLDTRAVRAKTAGLTMSVDAWLAANGNLTLPTTNGAPTITNPRVKYSDAFRAGYHVHQTDMVGPISMDYLSDKKHLYLQREDTDFELFYRSVLTTVNGFFHNTDYDVNGAYIRDAVKSRDICGLNNIGLHSFRELGRLEFIPLTKEMLYKRQADTPYRTTVDINLGVDHSDKTVILVVGGYLHLNDPDVFFRSGLNTLTLQFEKLNFLNRFYESRRFLDLTELGLVASSANADLVNINDLYSDAVIERYLTMSQSFVVLLDNPNVYTAKAGIQTTRLPSQYTSHVKPDMPLRLGCGRMGDYWSIAEDRQWLVSVADGYEHHYIYNTTDAKTLVNVDDSRIPAWPKYPFSNARATFLDIRADVIEYK